MSAAPQPRVIDLFNAHLADRGDLRTLVKRAPAGPRRASPRRPSVRAAGRKAHTVITSARHRRDPGAGERGLLLVLDESREAMRAVTYVGKIVGRRRGFRVCMAYVLPELPPELLEHGGEPHPGTEEQLAASLRDKRRRWIAQRKRDARHVIDGASTSLRRAGLTLGALETRFCGPVSSGAVADELLGLARARRCRTVVVGRRRRSWLGHLFAGDLRDELVGLGERIAIWGIG